MSATANICIIARDFPKRWTLIGDSNWDGRVGLLNTCTGLLVAAPLLQSSDEGLGTQNLLKLNMFIHNLLQRSAWI